MNNTQAMVDIWVNDYWGVVRDDRGELWHKSHKDAYQFIDTQLKNDSSRKFRIRDYWGCVVWTNKEDEKDVS